MANNSIEIRYTTPRVRLLREALKFTKAETARRAQLTLAQYAWFEAPAGRSGRRSGRVCIVPAQWVERLAITLGTTTDYICTGKTDAQPLPPKSPLRAMYAAFEIERKNFQRDARRYERNRKTLENLVESISNELKTVRAMGDAAVAMRADDAEFFREMAKSILVDNDAGLAEAAERMARGEPARPDYIIVDADQCCERDTNHDGNCDIHSAPGVLR